MHNIDDAPDMLADMRREGSHAPTVYEADRNSEVRPELPGYRVLGPLGQGGMASVWLAQPEGRDEPCVVKTLRPEVEHERTVRMRFEREAEVSKRLSHPNIARTLRTGQVGPCRYLAMEYIPGCELDELAARWSEGRVPAGLCGAIAFRILEALEYAHGLRDPDGTPLLLVHRDLTPRNVMVTYGGQIKLIDFGMVRTDLGAFRTEPGMIAGTARYMSPEQAAAQPVDARSDLYSLGVVLYELLTGRPVVAETRLAEILQLVAHERPVPPSEVNPLLPRALDEVLLRALEKRPEDRYQTARAFKVALRDALKGVRLPRADEIGAIVRELFAPEYLAAVNRYADGACDDTFPSFDPLARPMDIVAPWALCLDPSEEVESGEDATMRLRRPRAPVWASPSATISEEPAASGSTRPGIERCAKTGRVWGVLAGALVAAAAGVTAVLNMISVAS